MKKLKELKWVRERELKKKGKGRPNKEYELIVDLKDIVRELVKAKREELNKNYENAKFVLFIGGL